MKKALAPVLLFLASTLSFAVCNEVPKSDYREDIKYYDWHDHVERKACKDPYVNKMGIKIRICESMKVYHLDGGCDVFRHYYQEAYDARYDGFTISSRYSVPIFDKKGRQIAEYSPFVDPFKYGDGGSLVCIPSQIEALHIKTCKRK